MFGFDCQVKLIILMVKSAIVSAVDQFRILLIGLHVQILSLTIPKHQSLIGIPSFSKVWM